VRFALASQLQQAARNELLKSSSYIDIFDLETDAENAFDALSTLLSEDEFFFGRTTPGIFDASVFAYTHLLLDESMHWKYNRLGQLLRRHPNLVNHRDRLLQAYF
jgi:metaxin